MPLGRPGAAASSVAHDFGLVHTEPMQLRPDAHTLAHMPQLATSLRVSTSQPLVTFLSQSARPVPHMPTLHTPAAQLGVALAVAHTLPQPPQFLRSADASSSQPSFWSPLQSLNCAVHAPMLQRPWKHAAVALGSDGQAAPQVPQLTIVCTEVHASPQQSCDGPHAWPHAPQLATVESEMHTP